MALLAAGALIGWIFFKDMIDSTLVALVAICIMVLTKVVNWDDILGYKQAWNVLVWFGTLVALAAGLANVGFVTWFAKAVGAYMEGFSPLTAMVALTLVFFFIHYMFASITAHVTAVIPVMLAVGSAIPGMNMPQFAMMLVGTLGIMGILTPYATGPSPVYYGSGYLPARHYWLLGAVFGVIFIAVYLLVGVPWLGTLY